MDMFYFLIYSYDESIEISPLNGKIRIDMRISIVMGIPLYRWMVYFMENPSYEWMIYPLVN